MTAKHLWGVLGVVLLLSLPVTGASSNNAPQVSSEIECGLCVFIIDVIYNYVNSNSTYQDVQRIVNGICSYVPTDSQQFCEEMITDFGDTIAEMIERGDTESVICTDIGFCNSTEARMYRASFSDGFSTPTCSLCKWLTLSAAFYEKTNPDATEEDQTRHLSEACGISSSLYRGQCNDIETKFSDVIIKYASSMDAEAICSKTSNCDDRS